MTAKFELGLSRKAVMDLLRQIVEDAGIQDKLLDMLLGILFKEEAALVNMTDTPSDYDTGKYLKSTADAAEWAAAPTFTVNMCRLTCTTQAAASNTLTSVSFSAESYDVGSWWTSGTTITVPADGVYLFTAETEFTFATDGSARFARISMYNTTQGSALIAERILSFDSPGADIDQVFGCAGTFDCTASDVINVSVKQDYAASKNFTDIIFSATQQD